MKVLVTHCLGEVRGGVERFHFGSVHGASKDDVGREGLRDVPKGSTKARPPLLSHHLRWGGRGNFRRKQNVLSIDKNIHTVTAPFPSSGPAWDVI